MAGTGGSVTNILSLSPVAITGAVNSGTTRNNGATRCVDYKDEQRPKHPTVLRYFSLLSFHLFLPQSAFIRAYQRL